MPSSISSSNSKPDLSCDEMQEFNAEHGSKTIETHDEVYSKKQHIPYRVIPQLSWSKIMFFALPLLIFSLASWEFLAYKMGHRSGTYQTGFDNMWAEERRKLDKPNNIKMVLLGSSRVLWGMDFNIMREHLGSQPLQLALPGTGPALFVKDIVDNTNFDGLLVVGVTPFLFNRMDEGHFGKGALDAYHHQSPSGYTGAKLQDFLSDYFAFLDEGIFDA
ncbi:MAG: hypothetical protein Q9M92_13465 [Enterobacterales bacterium]|nr:hypothetical protein [Enterobacterales bacterium]